MVDHDFRLNNAAIFNKLAQANNCNISYAQEGEDIILKRIFNNRSTGFYVDVGAHHPYRFSNTYSLHKQGWKGINIDATPGAIDFFNQHRPEDINIEKAISNTLTPKTFYLFNEPALNTFSTDLKDEYIDAGYEIIGETDIRPATLASILKKNIAADQVIDLLSIDVEGEDLQVLQSNDWQHYSPRVIIVELLGSNLQDLQSDPVALYLSERKYTLFSKLFNSAFFVHESYDCFAI